MSIKSLYHDINYYITQSHRLTIWTDESHATDFCGVPGCVHPSYISPHGGSNQMEWFPVQANNFHKLRTIRDKNRFIILVE